MNGNTKAILGSLLGLLLLPFIASAETAVITSNGTPDYSFGNYNTYFEIAENTTYYRMNAMDVPICRLVSGGALNGVINVQVRSATTTGTIVASSTIATIPDCGGEIGSYYPASTTRITFNNEFATDPINSLFIKFEYQGNTGTIYHQYIGDNATKYFGRLSPESIRYQYLGEYLRPVFTMYTDTSVWTGNNRVGSTTRMIECDNWYDLDCQISNAITFLFFPSDDTLEEWQNISLASSTPFGYVYDIPATFSKIYSTTTATWQLAIDFSTLGQHADAFRNIATSSVTVFDACWLNREVGEAGANMYLTYVIPAIKALMWLGVLFGLWTLAHRIF